MLGAGYATLAAAAAGDRAVLLLTLVATLLAPGTLAVIVAQP